MRYKLTAASLLAIAYGMTSVAQEAEPERIVDAESAEAAIDENEARQDTVVIIGSAIRGTPEDAGLPVEVYTAQDLELEGSPSALKFAKDLTLSGPTNGESNYFAGGNLIGSPNFNLRSLGADKTLTLLNGRRMSENLSNIPGIAIARTEVLKDGAAVIYGADAVGGVVNFVTRTDFTGVEARANYTAIDGSDGDYDLGIMAGFGEGDVNFVVAAEWEHRSQLETEERDFSSLPYAQNPLPWSTLTNLSRYAAIRDLSDASSFALQSPAPGIFVPGIYPDFTQDSCETQGGVFTGTACSYGYAPFYNLVEDQDIFRAYAQASGRVNDNMNFHIDAAYGQVKAPTQFKSPSLPALRGPDPSTGATFQYVVPLSNPYVDEFVQRSGADGFSDMFGRPTTGYSFVIFRPFAHQGNLAQGRGNGTSDYSSLDNQVWRVSGGVDGTLGDLFGPLKDVGYDFAVTYNSSNTYYSDPDYLGFRLQDALNGFGGPNCYAADQDPATSGIQAPGLEGVNGCEYFNPFSSSYAGNPELGLSNPNYIPGTENSAALVNWLFDPLISETLNQSLTYDAVFSGMTGIELPGGEIGWALGAQGRQLETRQVIPSNFSNGATLCPYPGTSDCPGEFGQGPFAFRGPNYPDQADQQSFSYFAETNLPFADTLNVQAAVRREEFSGGLDATVYKVSGKWDVFGPLSVRGSYGTNFAAPPLALTPGNLATVVRSYSVAGGDWLGGTTLTRDDVEPEEATSMNLGLIWQSRGFAENHDMRIMIDYFDIELEGEIGELATHSQIATAVFTGPNDTMDCTSPFADRISLNVSATTNNNGTCQAGATSSSDLVSVRTDLGNGSDRTTKGFDLSVIYNLPIQNADMTFGLTATRVTELKGSATLLDGVEVAPAQDFLGGVNFSSVGFASPEWRTNAFVNYNRDRHNARLTARYTSGLDDARFDDGPITPGGFQAGTALPFDSFNYGKVDSSLFFDATYVFDFNENFVFSGTINNLLDEDPPFVYTEFGYDPRISNPLKRTFEIGVKARF